MGHLKIGEVAAETGLSIDTIRFYETKGLLMTPDRSPGGFRLFRPEEIETLRFIRTAQEAGFSLDEVHELLLLLRHSRHVRPNVRSRLASRLAEKLEKIRGKISGLQALERDLKVVRKNCTAKSRQTHTI